MADDPPTPRPRANADAVPVADWTTVDSPQFHPVSTSDGHAGGCALSGSGVAPPASRTSTRVLLSSDSRAAMTEPAVPAPTTMKSYELCDVDIRSHLDM